VFGRGGNVLPLEIRWMVEIKEYICCSLKEKVSGCLGGNYLTDGKQPK